MSAIFDRLPWRPLFVAARPAAPDRASALSARTLSSYYIAALLIIALMSIAAHIILNFAIHQNAGAGALINHSGRQRMLSQRIAGLAAEYRLGDATARPDLISAIDEFDTEQARLAAGAMGPSTLGDGSQAARLRTDYAQVSTELRAYVADARAVVALPPGAAQADAPLKRLFAEARAPLLDRLNAIVALRQAQTERMFAKLDLIERAVLAAVLVTLGAEALAIFRPMIMRIELYHQEILRLVTIDALTNIANRRGFFDVGFGECARARRNQTFLSLLMLDVDHFKRINDACGHAGVDAVLRALAVVMHAALRDSDIIGRIGGEEFAMLLPATDLEGAALVAERLRGNVAAADIMFEGRRIDVTISIGIAAVATHGGTGTTALEAAMAKADDALYRAKNQGRNRVALAA